jgi:hypothetical protein
VSLIIFLGKLLVKEEGKPPKTMKSHSKEIAHEEIAWRQNHHLSYPGLHCGDI